MINVHLLFQEISDQLGTSEVIGVFSTAGAAGAAAKLINRRTYVKHMTVDELATTAKLKPLTSEQILRVLHKSTDYSP